MKRFSGHALLAILLATSACKDGDDKSGPKSDPKEPGRGEAFEKEEDAEPAPPAGDPAQPAFEEPVINVGTKTGSAELTLILRRTEDARRPRRGKVPFTTEPYVLSVEPSTKTKKVSEADVFGTGLALDLDGDGDSDDELDVACEDGVASVGGERIESVMELSERTSLFRYRRDAGGGAVRLGGEGAGVLLYGPCDSGGVTFGLGAAGEPIPFEEAPSPAVQILVFERAEGPGGESSVRFQKVAREGDELEVPSYGGSLYEALPLDPEPRWYTSRWMMVPLEADPYQQRIEVELTFEGEEERFAAVSINEGGAEVDRIRSRVGGVMIRPLNP